ncbi:hypothetical protein ANN_09700 [Periplaneta americana]|uniref:Uncharacterized protein n=1 Tax=Periplaneta americana TaxID=6978 RepID=A0ABQ8TPN5_PERAM|nr:hypothetical protein ANN_09700 [Periplaneta americana]
MLYFRVMAFTTLKFTGTIPHVLEDTPLVNRQHIHFLHDGAPAHFSRTLADIVYFTKMTDLNNFRDRIVKAVAIITPDILQRRILRYKNWNSKKRGWSVDINSQNARRNDTRASVIRNGYGQSDIALKQHLVKRLSKHQDHNVAVSTRSMEEIYDLIGNRIRDLPACSVTPYMLVPYTLYYVNKKYGTLFAAFQFFNVITKFNMQKI